MKSTMTAAARDYVRAFYRDNRLNLSAALVLTVLDVPAALVGSWLLGRIIDVIGTGDVSELARLAVFCGAFLLASLAVSLGMYRAKCAFIYRALAQYKSLAFERLSEKGVRAFAFNKNGANGSALVLALPVTDPCKILVTLADRTETVLASEEVLIENKSGRGKPYVVALMDNVIVSARRLEEET